MDIGLEFCDVAGEHVKWCDVAPEGPAKGWTRLARRFTIDAELWRLGVRGECPGSVWFDGLRIAPYELTMSASSSQLAVLWAVEDSQPVSLTTKAQQVKVVDIMNNPSTISTRHGLLRFSATASPTYLTSSAPWGRQ